MFNQLLDILQISRLSPKMLPRLLYAFDEPLTTEQMKDWKYGGEAKLEYKQLLFFYQYIYRILFRILDTVFTPYLQKQHKFVSPDPVVVTDFAVMLQFFFMIQNHAKFHLSYIVDFKPFNPIDGDPERILIDWAVLRGKFIDHEAKINNLIKLQAVPAYPIPYRLLRFNEAITNNLEKQRCFQSGNTVPADENTIQFTASTSKKRSVFVMLEKNIGQWTNKKEILKKVDIEYDDFRSIVSQLRKDINNQGLGDKLKIESDGKGGYRLTHLASETTHKTLVI